MSDILEIKQMLEERKKAYDELQRPSRTQSRAS